MKVSSSQSRQALLDRIASATARDQILIGAWNGYPDAMAEPADKIAALVDCARVLDAIDASYALIGGVAVGIHTGVPRATLDTDLAVLSSRDRQEIVAAMTAAGFELTGEFPHSCNFRHSGGEPVQLTFDAHFDPMIERAEHIETRRGVVRIVRKKDLIEMKRRAAADPARRRSKALRDRADLELLLGDVPEPDEGW